MNTTVPLMLAASLTLSSFSINGLNDDRSPAVLTARELISALRQSSEAKFVALFPTLREFQGQMNDNEVFYGRNLNAAKNDFAKTYKEELLPAVHRAYVTLLEEAEKRGVDWSEVTVVSVNLPETTSGFSPMSITFEQNGKTFDLLIQQSLIIEGRWRVSQNMEFI